MATDLQERLSDLASVTPLTSPPADLWSRGVRRRRIAAVARTSVAVVLVLLVGLGGWVWHSSRPVEPADTHGAPRFPDHLYRPSPWVHGFAGPPGRLVALGVAPRSSLLHTRQATYGVTASRGQYGFLDLPGFVAEGTSTGPAAALSPDGREVAYWVGGHPTGSTDASAGTPVVGVAVYDAVSGRTRSARFATEHGLVAESLVWSDSRTLVIGFDQLKPPHGGSVSALPAPVQVWRMEAETPTVLRAARLLDPSSVAAGHGFVAGDVDARRHLLVWPREPGRSRTFRSPVGSAVVGPIVSPGGDRVAITHGNRNPGRLWWGGIRALPRSTSLQPVGGPGRYYLPVAWADEVHVVALAAQPERNIHATARLDLVDVRTGAVRTLADSVPGGGNVWGVSVATDLLGAPSAHTGPPPAPWDPRFWLGALGVIAFVVALYVWGARVYRT